MRHTILWLNVLITIALSACGVAEPLPATDTAADSATATPRPTLDLGAVTVEPLIPTIAPSLPPTETAPLPTPPTGASGLIDQAKEDLAKRLGMSAVDIALIEYRDIEWPDGSLGCPVPGLNFTQVLVDGYVIWLGAGKRIYEYHGGGDRGPFLCENPIQIAPPPGNP